jgi:mannose-1-phosphate guanylyltransferase
VRAVVLVGGFGTRLRPLTLTTPKPMLPVRHVPIIERLIANLVRGGVDDVTLALGFKPEPFVEAFPDGTCAGARLHYAVEPEPLDTAGAIRFAADASGIDDTFVVANGDVLTTLDIGHLVAVHRERGAEATIHLIPVDDPSAFGVVELVDGDRIVRFVEKPAPGTEPSNLANAGTYVLEPSVLARIPTGRKVSIERETFPAIADGGRLFALATDDSWIDTGRPETYLQANIDALGADANDIHADARVDASAVIDRSVVSAGVVVAADTSVVRSVLLPGAAVAAGARVEDSMLMGHVGAGAVVRAAVIGRDAAVADGEIVVEERRPAPDQ